MAHTCAETHVCGNAHVHRLADAWAHIQHAQAQAEPQAQAPQGGSARGCGLTPPFHPKLYRQRTPRRGGPWKQVVPKEGGAPERFWVKHVILYLHVLGGPVRPGAVRGPGQAGVLLGWEMGALRARTVTFPSHCLCSQPRPHPLRPCRSMKKQTQTCPCQSWAWHCCREAQLGGPLLLGRGPRLFPT